MNALPEPKVLDTLTLPWSVGASLAGQPDGVRATMMDGSTVQARLEGSVLHVVIERPTA